jgi:hypothetical protein
MSPRPPQWVIKEICEMCIRSWRVFVAFIFAAIFWAIALLALNSITRIIDLIVPAAEKDVVGVIHSVGTIFELSAAVCWLGWDLVRKLNQQVSPPC